MALVERDVGVAHQLVGRGAVVRGDGQADGCGYADGLPPDGEGRGEGLVDALGEGGTGLGARGGAENDELVAAEAREEVVGAEPGVEALGDGFDQLVARLVTQRVVDVLEAVDVDIGGKRPLAVASGDVAIEELLDPLDHVDAVRQARQSVVLGLVPGLVFAL
nr:hypothetical protein [Methyloceanibacter superfactus]